MRRVISMTNAVGKRAIVEDVARGAGFRIQRGRRRELQQRADAAATASALLALVAAELPGGITQLESEIVPFLDFAASTKPKAVFEIGTQFGGNIVLFCRALPTVTSVIGVDLFVRNRAHLEALGRPGQRVTLLSGSSVDERIAGRVAQALRSAPLDLLFIDGDHSYAGVAGDFLRFRHMVRPGGLIAFHDIVPDDRLRHGVETDKYAGDVPVFWRRLKEHFEHREFVNSWEQEGCGIGVIIFDPSVAIPSPLEPFDTGMNP